MRLEAVETVLEFLCEQPLEFRSLGAALFFWLACMLSPSLVSNTTVMLESILDTA